MDLRLKPNTRGCFAFDEFSVVCAIERAPRPFWGVSAREVSPPRDFSQHDGFLEFTHFLSVEMRRTLVNKG